MTAQRLGVVLSPVFCPVPHPACTICSWICLFLFGEVGERLLVVPKPADMATGVDDIPNPIQATPYHHKQKESLGKNLLFLS